MLHVRTRAGRWLPRALALVAAALAPASAAAATLQVSLLAEPVAGPTTPVVLAIEPGGLTVALDTDAATQLPASSALELAAGTYTVTAPTISGWLVSAAACTDPDGGSTLAGPTVSADLDEGETVACTFRAVELARVTIIADAIPDAAQDFTVGGAGQTAFLDDDDEPTLPGQRTLSFAPGPLILTAAPVPGWTTEVRCNDGSRADARAITLDLQPGEELSCRFASTRDDALCAGRTATDAIVGSPGADLLLGTEGDDLIVTLGGDDTVLGEGGNDVICGGPGNDLLDGGPGHDTLEGGDGDDDLRGGSGDDALAGGDGDDSAKGASGADAITGDGGDDLLDGGSGNDFMSGGDGDDTVDGLSGADVIAGDGGDDVVRGGGGEDVAGGGDGDDTVRGGGNADVISGGDGDDVLYGLGGDDLLDGEAGDDVLEGGSGEDTLEGGIGDDRCRGEILSGCEPADDSGGGPAF